MHALDHGRQRATDALDTDAQVDDGGALKIGFHPREARQHARGVAHAKAVEHLDRVYHMASSWAHAHADAHGYASHVRAMTVAVGRVVGIVGKVV